MGKTFIQAVLDGEADTKDFEEWFHGWFNTDQSVDLDAYLGFSAEDSEDVISGTRTIQEIIDSYKDKR